MCTELKPGFRMMLVMTVLTGLVYPAARHWCRQVAFRDQADGSLIVVERARRRLAADRAELHQARVRSSAAIRGRQRATMPPPAGRICQPAVRPSAEAGRFDGSRVRAGIRIDAVSRAGRHDSASRPGAVFRADAVDTRRQSGLDPHISPANAQAQAARVAKARGVLGGAGAGRDRAALGGTDLRHLRRASCERPGAQSRPGSPAADEVAGAGAVGDHVQCLTMATGEGTSFGKRDPEALLRDIEAEERASRAGQLKVFLGYAPGVGKSFRLLDEGRRRHERGEDVVVAALQPDVPPDAARVIHDLERIPPREVDGVPVARPRRAAPSVGRACASSTDSPTTTLPAHATPGAIRTSRRCSKPASPS